MWNRAEVKKTAKARLRNFYWQAVGISIIVVFVPRLLNGFLPAPNFTVMVNDPNGFVEMVYSDPKTYFGIYFAVFGIMELINIFVASPLRVGMRKYYLEADEGRADFNNILFAFKNNYLNIVKVTFLRDLFIALWTMLFVIPGIVKLYQYYFIDWILAENPNITFKEAKNQCFTMTKNEKLNLFVLDLSFIGWEILGVLLCGIGTLFVMPYMTETDMLVYKIKKGNYYYSEVNVNV